MTGRRVGILGGSFDPIHCGHLDVARAAEAALELTHLFILPSSTPPHRARPVASSYHRFAMAALAIAGRPRWRVSDLELLAAAPSYTVTTLDRLHGAGYSPAELFFLTGADAFAEIAAWKDYPAVLDRAQFAVVSRPGAPVDELRRRLPDLAYRMKRPEEASPGSSGMSIFLIDAATSDVSSTAIRTLRGEGRPIAGLVPAAVQQHIEQHGLYMTTSAADDIGGAPAAQAAGGLHERK